MTLTLLVDNPASWIVPYAQRLETDLRELGHTVVSVQDQQEIQNGDVAFFLGCEKLVKPDTLKKNTHNIVIHESDLPLGKGWSPLTWQILEGKNEIPMTLFEAKESVDSGDVYLRDVLYFTGHELNDELKRAQGEKTIELVKRFVENYPLSGVPQVGSESFYPKRTPKDSELDIHKTIAEQFDLLRVVDNERYPAFFHYRGHTYFISIKKDI